MSAEQAADHATVLAPSFASAGVGSASDLAKALAHEYIADAPLAMAAWLALKLPRPLLIEGPAGVGKTDLARALAVVLERELLRLQCYEGLDESKALYEWDYAKQMLFVQMMREAGPRDGARLDERAFYDRRFLIERPLLRALTSEKPAVLLIDEVDRADPEFEAFLLEFLAEGQVTIPELGRITSPTDAARPLVILTTNGTRDLTDALRRRCVHAFIDYPPPSVEAQIIALRVPGIAADLTQALVAFAAKLRTLDLRKAPGVSEVIDYARSLLLLGKRSLDRETAEAALGVLVKYEEDRAKVTAVVDKLV